MESERVRRARKRPVKSSESGSVDESERPRKRPARAANGALQCPWDGCNHTCKYPSVLEIHIRVHTREKPFRCPYTGCDHACTQKTNLKTHFNLQHTDTKLGDWALDQLIESWKVPTPIAYEMAKRTCEAMSIEFPSAADRSPPSAGGPTAAQAVGFTAVRVVRPRPISLLDADASATRLEDAADAARAALHSLFTATTVSSSSDSAARSAPVVLMPRATMAVPTLPFRASTLGMRGLVPLLTGAAGRTENSPQPVPSDGVLRPAALPARLAVVQARGTPKLSKSPLRGRAPTGPHPSLGLKAPVSVVSAS